MPTRKQRRRQEKLRRHEWEEVWVNDSGQELEPDAAEVAKPKRETIARNGAKTQARDAKGRPIRQIPPPSWGRVLKRAAIFLPLMFVVIALTNKHGSTIGRIVIALFYAVMLIPLMYLMDRTTHRAYLRRTGQAPSEPPRRKRSR